MKRRNIVEKEYIMVQRLHERVRLYSKKRKRYHASWKAKKNA